MFLLVSHFLSLSVRVFNSFIYLCIALIIFLVFILFYLFSLRYLSLFLYVSQKNCMNFSSLSERAVRFDHLILIQFITPIIFCDLYTLWKSSMVSLSCGSGLFIYWLIIIFIGILFVVYVAIYANQRLLLPSVRGERSICCIHLNGITFYIWPIRMCYFSFFHFLVNVICADLLHFFIGFLNLTLVNM